MKRLKKILLTAMTGTGIIIIVYAFLLCTISNFNAGLLITFGFGVLLALYGIFYDKINAFTGKGIKKALRYACYAVVLYPFIAMLFLTGYGNHDTVRYDEDAVIILGAGIRGDYVPLPLSFRLDKGAEYYRKNPNAVIVVSGGQGPQESVTEALAMERYLINAGVPKEKIIREEKATSTYENFKNSKEILDSYFNRDYRAAFITNGFHVYRASRLAALAGFNDIKSFHAGLQWYIVMPTYFRESIALVKLWVFRC